jgi:hypothetical protein
MFAPPVAKPKTKTAEPQRATVVPQRPSQAAVGQAQLLQRRIGNQALIRLLAQQASVTRNEPGAQEKEPDAARTAGRKAAPSWDFSQIPLFSSGRAERFQMPPLFPAPRLPIQAKLRIGQVDDPLEHEADRVADQVMRMPAQEVSVAAAPPQFSRKCDACEEEEKLQKKPAGPQAATGEVPAIVTEVLRSPGQPLDPATRAFFEPRFGHEFSRVRVHADESAAQSAAAVGAAAYTVGSHVAFAAGRYAPATGPGRQLLAHELAHVVQQRAGEGPLRRQTDLDAALAAHDWQKVAEFLNGFNPEGIRDALAKLNRGVVASIYVGAIDNPRVGPDSAIAHATRATYLDLNYENELRNKRWREAAKYLNGFNRDDINARLQKRSTEEVQAIHDGAVANPEVGDKSQVAEVTAMLITRQKNAPVPQGEVLGIGDTIPHKGDPLTDPNYIEKSTKGIGIPIWGGPLYLKQTDTPGWSDCVVVPRSDVFFVDPLAKQPGEIQLVYRTREAALKAVQQFAVEGTYAFYQGQLGRIVPTIISATTAPAITQTAQNAIKGEGEDAKAAEKLGIGLLFWYIGARYPAKVGETSAAKQAVKSSLQDILGETEYAALKAAAETTKAAHPELAALTADEIIAIRAYSGESWSYLNAALRLKDAKELTRLEQFISLMKSGISKLPVFKGTVNRTIAMQVAEAAQEYKVGATVVEDAFTSTTFGKAVAQREGNVLLTIESSTGRDITAAAVHAESEVLFAPGAKFVVTRVQQVGSAFLVWMKEVL